MTDAHLVSHAFQLSHPLSSSGAWSLLDESRADESAPSLATPFPTVPYPASSELSATCDLTLNVTPERTVSSHVPLQRHIPRVSDDDCEPDHRATKVHFDQTVSVHHLSPEYSSTNESPDDYRLSELDTDVLSSVCSELNTSDAEPISVVASDLRCLSPSSILLLGELESSRSLQHSSSAGKNLLGIGARNKKSKSSSSPSRQVVTELGNTGRILAECVRGYPDDKHNVEPECLLAKPDFNSTLKMSNEIAQLQEQQFDLAAVTKEKISPKLQQQLFEKACLKVNPDSVIYPDLISLEVSESDVLSRAADEQASRVRPTDAAADKVRPEDKISRVPDVLDFFTADLHKESPSVSLVAIPSFHLTPQTADLDRAFDLYQHIRTWDTL